MSFAKRWTVGRWKAEVILNSYCVLVGVNIFTRGDDVTGRRGCYVHLGPLILGVWQ